MLGKVLVLILLVFASGCYRLPVSFDWPTHDTEGAMLLLNTTAYTEVVCGLSKVKVQWPDKAGVVYTSADTFSSTPEECIAHTCFRGLCSEDTEPVALPSSEPFI